MRATVKMPHLHPEAHGATAPEVENHCAYNLTRECYLGFEVSAGDFSPVSLAERMPALKRGSGAGLWLVPFRGIPATNVQQPLDLIYLDRDCKILETVEFFPSFHVSDACPPAATVLALPAHSIFTSQSQPGDQLLICPAGEMKLRQEAFAASKHEAPAIEISTPAKEELNVLHFPTSPQVEQQPKPPPPIETPLAKPAAQEYKRPKGWLARIFSDEPEGPPELRNAARTPFPGLAAHFWTGGESCACVIRNISSTGLYVVTGERWYPGTLVLMTLTQTEREQAGVVYSITVQTQAMRWGNDGVGLRFILPAAAKGRSAQKRLGDGADREEMDQFLECIRKASGADAANPASS